MSELLDHLPERGRRAFMLGKTHMDAMLRAQANAATATKRPSLKTALPARSTATANPAGDPQDPAGLTPEEEALYAAVYGPANTKPTPVGTQEEPALDAAQEQALYDAVCGRRTTPAPQLARFPKVGR